MYTPLSNITRTEIKNTLNINEIFNELTTTQQNAAIDFAVQKIASLRNSCGYDDYVIDALSDVVSLPVATASKALVIKIVEDEGNVTASVSTIVSQIGYSGTITISISAAGVISIVSNNLSEFGLFLKIDPNQGVEHERTNAYTVKLDQNCTNVANKSWGGSLLIEIYEY